MSLPELDPRQILDIARNLAILVLGLATARGLAALVTRVLSGRASQQSTLVTRRLVFYAVAGLTIATVLRGFGVDLSVLLGAAGILTVALGFASQTSASNVISGLMLMGERPFVIGDVVRVAELTGEVVSIDLISVKLRTFDNLLVRIPNESLLKSNITNLTHFPIRRVDLRIGVAYHEDLRRVRSVLGQVADDNPLCMDEPKPVFQVLGFGESSIDLQYSVWGTSAAFLDLRTSMNIEIKEAFDRAGIEIPFPHRTLYTGSRTAPLPIRLTPTTAKAGPETGSDAAPLDAQG
jgi:small-conductance mechanosensitive channel